MDVCLLWILCVGRVQASATGQPLVQRSLTRVYRLSLRVIRCDNDPLHYSEYAGGVTLRNKNRYQSQSPVLQFSEVSILSRSWKLSCGYQMFISNSLGNGSAINVADTISTLLMVNLTSCGPGSSVGIATAYGLEGPGIDSRWGEIFRTSLDRSWGPPSLLYNGYRVFPRGKVRPGRDADP